MRYVDDKYAELMLTKGGAADLNVMAPSSDDEEPAAESDDDFQADGSESDDESEEEEEEEEVGEKTSRRTRHFLFSRKRARAPPQSKKGVREKTHKPFLFFLWGTVVNKWNTSLAHLAAAKF